MLSLRSTALRRSRRRGFTLAEILTVVAITGVLAAVAMVSLSGAGNEQNAAALARSIQFAMLRARNEAFADGSARQLRCGPSVTSATVGGTFSGCSFFVATNKGMVPAGWTEESNNVQASWRVLIWNVAPTSTASAASAGALPMSSNSIITFYPTGGVVTTGASGTSAGATVFVCDKNGQHRYKVFAFGATGLSKLVSSW
jgi:prepilin-type N-terminal cleavage/methylation domain-containing protein